MNEHLIQYAIRNYSYLSLSLLYIYLYSPLSSTCDSRLPHRSFFLLTIETVVYIDIIRPLINNNNDVLDLYFRPFSIRLPCDDSMICMYR